MVAGTLCCARKFACGILVLLRRCGPVNMLCLFCGLSRVCVRLPFVSDWYVVYGAISPTVVSGATSAIEH